MGPRFARRLESLELRAGERVLLLGPSGSGKSSLLNLITGIAAPSIGTVEILGHAMVSNKPAQADRLRGAHVGLIFQQLNLLPYASVAQNIALALRFSPVRRARLQASVAQTIAQLLQALDLEPALAKVPAARLSQGQQQRVAAARALIGAPELIVADEPSSALDAANRDRFFQLLFGSLDGTRQAALVVSHDQGLVPLFDRVLEMDRLTQPWTDDAMETAA